MVLSTGSGVFPYACRTGDTAFDTAREKISRDGPTRPRTAAHARNALRQVQGPRPRRAARALPQLVRPRRLPEGRARPPARADARTRPQRPAAAARPAAPRLSLTPGRPRPPAPRAGTRGTRARAPARSARRG